MAKVILSGLVDSITGKLGGSVFQGTVGGLQLRNKVSPRNPRTSLQQVTRSAFAFLLRTWSALSLSNRNTWFDSSPVLPQGIDRYMTSNQLIAYSGNALINTYNASTAFLSLNLTISSLDAGDFTITMATDPFTLGTNEWLNVYATPQLSAGLGFISPSEYRYLMSFPPGTNLGTSLDILAEYTAKYNAPVTGNLIGVAGQCINVSNGVFANRATTSGYSS